MGSPITVKNATDTYLNQAANTKQYGQKARIWLNSTGGAQKRGLVYFAKPWTPGCTIQSGKVRVWNHLAWAGSVTLTIQRATKWDVNKATWQNSNTVGTGATVTVTKTAAAAGTMWEFDVSALLQTVANGAPWFGFIITTNRTTDGALYSTQAGASTMRPVMVVAWNDGPDEPDDLLPRDNLQVSQQRPIFQYDFNDTNGESDLAAQQIQFGASTTLLDAGTTTFDTTEMATTVPEYDSTLTTPAGIWPGLADLATAAWRVRAKDSGGVWSIYSDAVLFGRTTKGTLTINNPSGGIYDPSLSVSWTLSGRTQRAFQVAIALADDPNNWLWDSGKITSTDTSQGIPFGVIKDASLQYIIIVRVWDTIARVATPNDPMYTEATTTLAVSYDATVANVTALAAASDPLLPIEHLTFTSITSDSFVLQRSADGGATWYYVKEVIPAEALVSGTNYAIDDNGAAQYVPYTWRVLRVVGGRQSGPATIPSVSGQVRRLAPFLTRKDGTDALCFLNPKRSRAFMDQQGKYDTQAGSIIVTQNLGGSGGTVEGRFTADSMPGVTAKDQFGRFDRIRKDVGQQMTLYVADEAFNVVAYNMQIDSITDAHGITYQASFDWIEVPES